MAFERLEACPVCSKSQFKNFLICKDNSVSGESFLIVECENCTFKFTNPRPDQESIGRYYESEEYISHSNSDKGLINKAYKLVRSITINQKLALVNKLSEKKGKILDYGCGTGHFLASCQKDGWDISGLEPGDTARKIAEEQLKQQISKGNLADFSGQQFQVITLWHVLEHIHDLNGTLASLVSLLAPNGKLVIAVPNADSFDAHTYKEYWAAYDVPRHLYHFNQATIKRLLKKHKLTLVETKPMKFDAYYVSMLSEQYLNQGKPNMVKAVVKGLKSNQYGKQHSDYSSLIYISEKKA